MEAPPEGDNPPVEGLIPPRSRYTLTAIFNIWPEDIQLTKEQTEYEHMPEHVRQMFRDFRVPKNRFLKACRYQAEICPKTNHCHIQLACETFNKSPTPVEVLHYLKMSDRNAMKIIHPNDPRSAFLYCNKEASRMPGAEPQGWGELPPVGEYPQNGHGGKRERSGANCVSVEEYHQMVKLQRRPQNEFLLSPFGRKLKVKEVWDMLNARPTTRFKGVDARKYVSIYWSATGDLGKSTRPWLWAQDAGLNCCKAVTAERGMYGRWLDGFDNQEVLILNEFEGNWYHGFHDFLDFLDNQNTRLMEVKKAWVNTDFEFIFINSNYDPRNWVWYFPREAMQHHKGYRTLDMETEWPLFERRLKYGKWAGCGIEEWDNTIPKERSLEQVFLYDFWYIRQMEEGAPPPPPRLRRAFDLPGPVRPAIPPLLPVPLVWPVPAEEIDPPAQRRRGEGGVMELLQQLAEEEGDQQQQWNLNHVALIPSDDEASDWSAQEARLIHEEGEESIQEHPLFFQPNEDDDEEA